MHELPFQVELEWSGTGRDGAGRIVTDDLEFELSTPASMGGRGAGTNPEELLVCAVGACYAATLLGVLRRAALPAASVNIDARGTVYLVDGSPGRVRRFSTELEDQGGWSVPRLPVGPAIAVADSDGGAVYITGPDLGYVRRYAADGRGEWTVGAAAGDPFKLSRPVALATDAAGSVYVLDAGRNQVFRYDVTRRPS